MAIKFVLTNGATLTVHSGTLDGGAEYLWVADKSVRWALAPRETIVVAFDDGNCTYDEPLALG